MGDILAAPSLTAFMALTWALVKFADRLERRS